jgi:hypothetical protein
MENPARFAIRRRIAATILKSKMICDQNAMSLADIDGRMSTLPST